MKKNITINLYGQLYAIDEDAFNMLECYLDSMKKLFASQEDGEEIADDIEHRVAEILWEKKENGLQAIDIEVVKSIIKQIGDPSEIDNSVNEESGNAEKGSTFNETFRKASTAAEETVRSAAHRASEHLRNRRFYLNRQDRILGGVCSGLAQYFGGHDPLPWRLAVVLLAFLSLGITVIIYVLIWLIAPVASTPEDKLRMKGMEVNSANLSEQILSENEEKTQPNKPTRGCLSCLLMISIIIVLFPFILILGLGVVGCLLLWLTHIDLIGNIFLFAPDDLWIVSFWQQYSFFSWCALLCILLVCIIPIFAFARLLNKNPEKKLSASTTTWLTVTWIIALIIGIACIIFTAMNYEQYERLHAMEDVRGLPGIVFTEEGGPIQTAGDNAHWMSH